MQRLALRGLHTGGRCFGYTSVKNANGSAKLEVNKEQAEIVHRSFLLCAESGYSLRRIAHTLNSEGILAPQPQKGRLSRSWCVSSVRHVLLNRKYVGKTIWNTKRKLRVPGTSKRVYRPRPESEWTTLDTPHLRIVSDELFAAAGRRFEKVKQTLGRPGQESSGLVIGPRRYLFSGLLKCAECGGSISLVSGRGRNGADRYGCSLNHQRGVAVCSNSLLVRRDELEESLLKGLSESVLKTEVVDYAVAKMEVCRPGRRACVAESAETGTRFGTQAAHGFDSARPAVSEAHEALAESVGQLTLEATNENGKKTYLAHGKVDFFGEEELAHSDGAGAWPVHCSPRTQFKIDVAA
jgi:hypothetical protein